MRPVTSATTAKIAKIVGRSRRTFIKMHGQSAWNKRFSREVKAIIVEAYGGKCKCCGESIPEFLTIDHTCKKTRQMHRKVGGKGHRFYKWLIKSGFPKVGIRLLCMNCNLAVAWGRVCPHKVRINRVSPRRQMRVV